MFCFGHGLVLSVFYICVFQSLAFGIHPAIPNTTAQVEDDIYYPSNGGFRTGGRNFLRNCSFVPEFPDVKDHIANLVTDSKLVKISIHIIGEQGALNDTATDSVYRPNKWIISTSLTGNSILMLKEYFQPMSLGTLGSGIASTSLTLIQNPESCLKDAEVEDIENSLRLHFLNNFEVDGNRLPENAVICNSHIIKYSNSDGHIRYVCCSRTLDNSLVCSVLKESVWFRLLFISISIVQALAILYSPNLMPNSIYKAGNVFKRYIFKTEAGSVIKLNVMKVHETSKVETGFVQIMQDNEVPLTTLRSKAQDLIPGKLYTFYVDSVELDVRRNDIIAEGNAPVSVLKFVKNFFVRCFIRYEVASVKKCCNEDMFISLPCRIVLQWYQCLSFIMTLIMVIFISSPWLFRVWFYYQHEQEPLLHQAKVLQARNLAPSYPGNMLSYLSPTHSVYLGQYILFFCDCIMYTFLPNVVKRKLKFTVGQCIRDMRKTQKLEACGFFMSQILWPLQRFGILGMFVLPLWCLILPLCLLYLALEVFPVANLSIRLLINAFYYTLRIIKPDVFDISLIGKSNTKGGIRGWIKNRLISVLVVKYEKTNKRRNQIIQAVSLMLTLLTMWALLFIAIDCISFYVECAVYILVGFILNPGDTMKYVSLLLLISVYGNECFSGVYGKYAAYSKTINREVQRLVGSRLNEEAAKPEAEQDNVAFRVPVPDLISERLSLEVGSKGRIQWRAQRLVLLLDEADIPYIPKTFLFEMGRLRLDCCPGKIHLLYLYALRDFSLIIIFLMFVFIVIFAFGQAHDISSGGQTIAALGSGFLPLVLRKFLFQTQKNLGIDGSNLRWKNMFANAVKRFATTWNIIDVHIKDIQEIDSVSKLNRHDQAIGTESSADNNDAACVDVDIHDATELMERDSIITEDSLRGNIDLIVKSIMNRQGEKEVVFYVRDMSFNDSITDEVVNVVNRASDEETIV